MIARWLVAMSLICLGAPAAADELKPGFLQLTERAPQEWEMLWKAPIRAGLASRARPRLPADCKATPSRREIVGGALVERTTYRCAKPIAGREIALSGLGRTVTDALIRVAPLGRPVQAARVTPDAPAMTVAAETSRWQVAQTYFAIGVEHILFGFDHLLFVLAMVLLLLKPWPVAKAVTAFTVAHSITLAGTTLGLFGLPQAPVESVIALSIVFLAVEIAKAKPGELRLSERVPWIVAFAFGLLHGFGFAGALREIGLPEGEVPMALLTFNLGVEAGQLAVVVAGVALLWAIGKLRATALDPARHAASYAIGSIAAYWFIDRTLF